MITGEWAQRDECGNALVVTVLGERSVSVAEQPLLQLLAVVAARA